MSASGCLRFRGPRFTASSKLWLAPASSERFATRVLAPDMSWRRAVITISFAWAAREWWIWKTRPSIVCRFPVSFLVFASKTIPSSFEVFAQNVHENEAGDPRAASVRAAPRSRIQTESKDGATNSSQLALASTESSPLQLLSPPGKVATDALHR